MVKEGSAESTIRDIKRKTRRKYSAEDKNSSGYNPSKVWVIQKGLKRVSNLDE